MSHRIFPTTSGKIARTWSFATLSLARICPPVRADAPEVAGRLCAVARPVRPICPSVMTDVVISHGERVIAAAAPLG